jgi:hypothetical protein
VGRQGSGAGALGVAAAARRRSAEAAAAAASDAAQAINARQPQRDRLPPPGPACFGPAPAWRPPLTSKSLPHSVLASACLSIGPLGSSKSRPGGTEEGSHSGTRCALSSDTRRAAGAQHGAPGEDSPHAECSGASAPAAAGSAPADARPCFSAAATGMMVCANGRPACAASLQLAHRKALSLRQYTAAATALQMAQGGTLGRVRGRGGRGAGRPLGGGPGPLTSRPRAAAPRPAPAAIARDCQPRGPWRGIRGRGAPRRAATLLCAHRGGCCEASGPACAAASQGPQNQALSAAQ